MGSWGPIGGGGELIASSCGTAVTQNEKTQEMDHKESRPWTAPLRRPQGRDQHHPHGKEMQKSKMAVWGGLTNSCAKAETLLCQQRFV